MEAVSRLPMLAFELKHSPEYVDFGPTLKKYIHEYYGEDPAVYNKACSDLDQLRQNAIHVTRDFVGCATLKRYFAQLHFLNGRFPMGEGGEASVTFTWEDNQTGRDHMIADIKFEQACILYNIGALHSNLGAIDTRQNAEGMKVSCTHFQCAAWAFEYLRDHFGSSGMSTDMSHELLTFHINVMLAQAQECILEKSMIDSRKNTITAKVAAQVVEFYKMAVKNLDQSNTEQIINSRSYKDWRKRIELKIAFYQCITNYYMGRHAEDQQKWGERLAYFQACQNYLNEAVKFAKNEVPEMQEALRFAQDVVGGKLAAAQKDNDFIYHEKIPPIESLPEVKGAPLVKGIPFDPTDPEISGADIFLKLVPMEAHEAASIYSEEKAKVLRQIGGEIESKNAELDQFMNSLQIDQSIFDHLPDRLPQELLEKCAAMSVRTNAIKELVESMSGISGLATEAEMNIKEIQELIAEDHRKTEEFEQQFGKKMVSAVLPNLAKDCESHLEKHSQGSQLNSTLHAAMNTHITNLRLLALPPDELQKQLPSARPPRSEEDEQTISELRRLLNKVEEMRTQRTSLENQLREQLQKDDITTVLVAQESSRESIYKTQLKKHDAVVTLIMQNLSAQSNILRALTDANAKFATLRQAVAQNSANREAVVKDLINSFEKYEELLAKSQKGQDYYCRLNEAVTKTLERCHSECKVRQEERDMLVTKYAPKVPPPSRPSAPKPGQPPQPGVPATTPAEMPATATSAGSAEERDRRSPLSAPPVPLSAFEGPRLKDYLPFMKPQSFGSNRSTPSPQSLPPGSPDVTMSGPPSLSSDSSSPKHRPQPPPNTTDLTMALPRGMQGYAMGMMYSAPDVTAVTHTPARVEKMDSHDLDSQAVGWQPLPMCPPDITANIPVKPGQAVHYGSMLDASGHSLPAGNYPQYRQADITGTVGFASLPVGVRDGAGGLRQPRHQDFAGGNLLPAGSNSLSLSTDSVGSLGSLQSGYRPESSTSLASGQGAHNIGPKPPLSAQFPASAPAVNFAPNIPPQQHIQSEQSFQPALQQQQPGLHSVNGQMPQISAQQGLIKPSSAPSQVLHPATAAGYQHFPGAYVSGGPPVSGNIPQPTAGYGVAGNAAPGAVNPPQTGQPHYHQHRPTAVPQQHQLPPQILGQTVVSSSQPVPQGPMPHQQSHIMGPISSVPAEVTSSSHMTSQQPAVPLPTSYLGQQAWGVQSGVQGGYATSTFGGQVPAVSQHSQAGPAGQGISHMSQDAVPKAFGASAAMVGSQQPGQQMPQSLQQFPTATPQNQPQQQNPPYPAVQPGYMPSYHPHQTVSGQVQSFSGPFQVSSQAQVSQQAGSSMAGACVPGQQAVHVYHPASSVSQPAVQPVPPSSLCQPGYFAPGGSPAVSTSACTLPGSQPPQLHPQQQHPRPSEGGTNFGGSQGFFQGAAQVYRAGQQFPASQGSVQQVPTTPSLAGQESAYIQQQQQLLGHQGQQVHPGLGGPQLQYPQQPLQQQASQQFPQARPQQAAGQPQQYPGPPLPQQHQHYPQHEHQQQHQLTQYPQVQQYPPEARLTLPTPLQPSRVPSADTVSPPQHGVTFTPAQQQTGPATPQPSGQNLNQNTSVAVVHPHLPPQPTVQSPAQPPAQPPNISNQASAGATYGASLSRQKSSLDELLSSSPEDSKKSSIPDPIITPKVLTDQEKQQQKEEAMKKGAIVEKLRDPYENSSLLNKFVSDIEAFGKFVDDLSISILGVSRLDTVWKSLTDSQDHEMKKHSIAIARCYPMKNRDADIMPYDDTRVVLTSTKDDYINASWINDLAPSCPKFVATQAPLGVTVTDFWAMVHELGSEVIAQISSDYETGKNFPVYYPTDKGQQMEQGPIVLTLQSVKYRQLWTERNVYLKHSQTKQARTVIHLQFKSWPISGFPDDVQHVCRFISEVHSFYQQQRSLLKPIIVHCGSGIGRTGAFLLIYTGMQEILHGSGLIDIPGLAKRMLQKRKNIIHKKEQLKFCYDALLCFAEDFLRKRNILVQHPHFERKKNIAEPPQTPSQSDDIVLGSVDLHTIQQTVGRLHIHDDKDKDRAAAGTGCEEPDTPPTAPPLPSSCSLESGSSKDGDAFAALPDLIQQPHRSDSTTSASWTAIGGTMSSSSSSVAAPGVALGCAAEERPSSGVASPRTHSRSGSNASMHSVGSLAGSSSCSSRSSPQHGPPPSSSTCLSSAGSLGGPATGAAGLSQTLADLQDPKKFTLGKAEQKRRITRDSFDKKAGGGLEGTADPDDPLSSLDPMWTIHRPRQQSGKN